MVSGQCDDLRVPLASERTLLAWVRTALALMSFDFVIARFGLFLHELGAAPGDAHSGRSPGMSMWLGNALVAPGAVSALLAAWQNVRFLDRLERGDLYRPRRSLGVLVAIVVALIGGLTAWYLWLMANGLAGVQVKVFR